MLDPTTRVAELPDKLGGRLYALIAGYPATFFARVEPGGFELPPDPKLDAFRGRGFALDWSLFYDIRVWGENGEWHAWRDDEWFDRTRMFEDLKDTLDYRDYPILGRHDVREDHGWILRSERRGPQVLPCFRSISTRWEPINPVPPITQHCFMCYGVSFSCSWAARPARQPS